MSKFGVRRGTKLVALATVVSVAALAGCGNSSTKSSGSSTTSGSGSSSTATGGGGGGAITAADIQWGSTFLGQKAGAANSSLSPVAFGWVNEQGGTLSFPDSTSAMQAAVDFVNKDLGGISGHPLVAHSCFGAVASDSLKCGEQMANDSAVKAVTSSAFELDDQAFFNALGGKKPYLDGQLVYPVDYTTPNVYSYYQSVAEESAQAIAVAQQVLHAKRMIVIRTDNPTGLAAFQGLAAEAKLAGLSTVQVPVPEPGTDPQYTAAISAVNPKPGDVILLYITAIGGASVYDALNSLGLSSIPVIGSGLMLLPPMPGHLQALGLKDTVYPNGWYYPDGGYSELKPTSNSNGANVYDAAMQQFAPSANTHGAAPVAWGDTLMLAKLLIEGGGSTATPSKLSQEMKSYTGVAPLDASNISCGALSSSPNTCYFGAGVMQRLNGQWLSIADGYNGKTINLLPALQRISG